MSACRVWEGRLNRDGYGRIGNRAAHRVIYEETVGPVPPGMELDHLCRVRACVNPEHLEPVTHKENMARSEPAQRTHCPKGHEYTAENTYLQPRTGTLMRSCKECRRATNRRWQERQS